jgi:hypothetical protein
MSFNACVPITRLKHLAPVAFFASGRCTVRTDILNLLHEFSLSLQSGSGVIGGPLGRENLAVRELIGRNP